MSERIDKTPEQALSSLMRLCSRAERSSGDAMRLMARWGVDPTARDGVLRRLIAERFIDDERYASAYVREKSRLNGWGVYKISQGLRTKGIHKDIIDAQLQQISRTEANDKLLSMMERRMKSLSRESDTYKLKGKLFRYGASLGYDFEAVSECVDSLIKQRVDEENF